MKKGKNKVAYSEKDKAGLVIIIISMIVLCIFLITSYIKFSGIQSTTTKKQIESNGLNAEISNEDVEADSLFASTYFDALSTLDGIAKGTDWLNICSNSQKDVNGEIYIKICDDNFKTVSDIKKHFSSYITSEYIEALTLDNYIDIDGSLYILPVISEKNSKYVEFDSYEVKQKNNNKIIYLVTSKYTNDKKCKENCEDFYRENTFVLEKENGKWLVSNFEMPY